MSFVFWEDHWMGSSLVQIMPLHYVAFLHLNIPKVVFLLPNSAEFSSFNFHLRRAIFCYTRSFPHHLHRVQRDQGVWSFESTKILSCSSIFIDTFTTIETIFFSVLWKWRISYYYCYYFTRNKKWCISYLEKRKKKVLRECYFLPTR